MLKQPRPLGRGCLLTEPVDASKKGGDEYGL